MDTLAPQARDLAERLLSPMESRWKHVQATAERATELAEGLSLEQRDMVVAAAWLHDIGYSPELERTGFHPIDGAFHLRDQGWPPTVVTLVAHHSGARFEAYVRGLSSELAEFGFENTALDDLLAAADLTRGPGGEVITFEEQATQIRDRYPEGSDLLIAWKVAEPLLAEAVARAENNLRWARGEITSDDATAARKAMVEALAATPGLDVPDLLAAFAAVPREVFVPAGTPLSQTYDPDEAIITRTDARGIPVSSVSAPWLQARMILQAELRPGDRVLEIGSGGYNAALLAEIVGPSGEVVTVDVDPWVTERTQRFLKAAGYADRVEVVTGDAELPLPGERRFDAIIITVGSWDIPPAWTDQLAHDGRLVVPLRMRLNTRSLSFKREDDHLVATSSHVCGFVAMQGIGQHENQQLVIVDPNDVPITFTSEGEVSIEEAALEAILASPGVEIWSGVTIETGIVDLSGLLLWMATHEPGWAGAMTSEGGVIHPETKLTLWPNALVFPTALATLTQRDLGDRVELGARGFGPDGTDAATRIADLLRGWDGAGRPSEPEIHYVPTHATLPPPSATTLTVPKTHGSLKITWTDSTVQQSGQR